MGHHHSKHITPAYIAPAPTVADIAAAKTAPPPCVEKRPWDECIPSGETKLATTNTLDPTTGRYVLSTQSV